MTKIPNKMKLYFNQEITSLFDSVENKYYSLVKYDRYINNKLTHWRVLFSCRLEKTTFQVITIYKVVINNKVQVVCNETDIDEIIKLLNIMINNDISNSKVKEINIKNTVSQFRMIEEMLS
jgi:hypothetical protein